MERKIVNSLLEWKNSDVRKPLLLYGARQVGKTYSCLMFGKSHYKNVAYFNFEDAKDLAAVFEQDLDPERIVRVLSARISLSIFKNDTLIIFDEIQACERALTSLKYFCENAPEYHIIAAGSLLGVALKREKYSFPVGKVDMLTLYPLDFEEFLWATENRELSSLIREHAKTFNPFPLHQLALDWYRKYLVIGGLPAVVAEYMRTFDYQFVYSVQKSLNDAYIADMAKYATPQETQKIMSAWSSIPGQLAKENHKFQYKLIKSGARANEYEVPIEWLRSAGMVHKCQMSSEGKLPLSAYTDSGYFKLYMMDTGLLCSKFNVPASAIIDVEMTSDGFRGALAENYVMQALISNGIDPYYWNSDGKAEVDFIYQDRRGQVIPIETKSSDNVRSKSLVHFIKKYNPPFSIRISAKNFGFENGLKSIPLYAAFCLEK